MKIIKIFRKITFIIFVIAFFVMLLPVCGYAEEENRLTISYRVEGAALKGVDFNIYYVAARTVDDTYTAEKDFQSFDVNDSAHWDSLAETMEIHVLQNRIAPAAPGTTDTNGKIELRGLKFGLYLVTGSYHLQDDTVYESIPFLVNFIPENGKECDMIAYPKYHISSFGENTVSRKVLKVWDDAGYEKERPKEIEVLLLQDGEVCEIVKLNAENNWRYTWEKLSAESRWLVAEKDPGEYIAKTERQGITFVITNSHKDDGQAPEKTPAPSKSPTLPKTGQIWWPVPLMVIAGILLIGLGLRGKKEN